jgi:hypothetical protein
MDAFSIREYGAIADAAALHDRFVSMTFTARLSDRGPVYSGVWIAGGQHRGEIAIPGVAITASRCFRAIVNSLGVETAIVICMSAGVKL